MARREVAVAGAATAAALLQHPSLAPSQRAFRGGSPPPWDCKVGMHEPKWIARVGTFFCGRCFLPLSILERAEAISGPETPRIERAE